MEGIRLARKTVKLIRIGSERIRTDLFGGIGSKRKRTDSIGFEIIKPEVVFGRFEILVKKVILTKRA